MNRPATEALLTCAAREAGHRVVAVLSARGKTTDELVSQALEMLAAAFTLATLTA